LNMSGEALSGDQIAFHARFTDGSQGIFLATLGAAGGDADGDGIVDDVDFSPDLVDTSTVFSGSFSDIPTFGGTSSGAILLRRDQVVTVVEEPNPKGLRLTAAGGPRPAIIFPCTRTDVIFPVRLGDGDEIIVSCGSSVVEVISGPVEVELGDDPLLTIPTGATAKITGIGNGGVRVENDAGSAASLILETGGQVVEIAPGQTSGGCDCGAPGAIVGTDGPDVLVGTDGPDIICGLGGNDKIMSGGGDECIDAGPGHDGVSAGSGNDIIFGREGDDSLYGSRGDDFIDGGEGVDRIIGSSGTDECINGERVDSCEL